jgi:hypothetical protein
VNELDVSVLTRIYLPIGTKRYLSLGARKRTQEIAQRRRIFWMEDRPFCSVCTSYQLRTYSTVGFEGLSGMKPT